MRKLIFGLVLLALPAAITIPALPQLPSFGTAHSAPNALNRAAATPSVDEPVTVTSTKQEPVQVSQSDGAVIIAISTSVLTLVGVMFNGIMAYLMKKLSMRAERVEQQAQATTAKINETSETVKVVHALVNSNMRAALAEALDFAQRLAELSKKPADLALAERARQRLEAHDAGQALADEAAAARNRTRRIGDKANV